ncbi:MAG: hypothetical protein U0470_10995 [Anaerolineae bacterium]|jgi:hypothetical protein
MFFNYPDIPPGAMASDRHDEANKIGEGLPRSSIDHIVTRFVTLRLPDGSLVKGDVAQSGFTVYFGGFDWVTYPTPPHVLQKFPQFMPLPQQMYRSAEDDEGGLFG